MNDSGAEHSHSDELSFTFGCTSVLIRPIDDFLGEQVNSGELYGTNETAPGLHERAMMVLQDAPVGSLIAVGRPEKVIAQAAALLPSSLTHIDISDQNILDGILLCNALAAGTDVRSYYETNRAALQRAMRQLFDFSGQGYRFGTISLHLESLQLALTSTLQALGASADVARQVVAQVAPIRLIRTDIKDMPFLAAEVAQAGAAATVLDASNIPLPGLLEVPAFHDLRILSALNAPEELLKDRGIWQQGKTSYRGNTVWHYGREGLFPKLPVVYSPDSLAYSEVIPFVNTRGAKW